MNINWISLQKNWNLMNKQKINVSGGSIYFFLAGVRLANRFGGSAVTDRRQNGCDRNQQSLEPLWLGFHSSASFGYPWNCGTFSRADHCRRDLRAHGEFHFGVSWTKARPLQTEFCQWIFYRYSIHFSSSRKTSHKVWITCIFIVCTKKGISR